MELLFKTECDNLILYNSDKLIFKADNKYLDINGNLNVYCEKNKEWSERAMHNKCYSCNKVFSCLNKMCPYKSVMNRNYVCENYRNFGNEG